MNPTGRKTPSVGSRPATMGKDNVGSAPLLDGVDLSPSSSESGNDEEEDARSTRTRTTRRQGGRAAATRQPEQATAAAPGLEKSATFGSLNSFVQDDNGDSDDDEILAPGESFMMTKEEEEEWEKRMEEHRQTIARRQEEFKNWSDSLTRRRMFAYARIKKLEKHFQARTNFLNNVNAYVTHNNAMHDRLAARAATKEGSSLTGGGGAGPNKATPTVSVSSPAERLVQGSQEAATPPRSDPFQGTEAALVNGDVSGVRTSGPSPSGHGKAPT